MAKICFVSFEIHPTVKGGCGVLLNNAAQILLSRGHEVIFLLDLHDDEFEQFDQHDRLNLPNAERCRAYQVQALVNEMPISPRDFRSVFEYRTHRFNYAARQVYKLENPDLIEFFEYTGSGYSALCTKIAGLDYQDTLLAVRLHGSLELIDRQQPGSTHGIDRYIMYGLEHQAQRLAEVVLVPSYSFYEKAYVPHYETPFGNVVVSKPPLVDFPRPGSSEMANFEDQLQDVILFYGRLQGIKGVDTFVDAAILYLSNLENPPRQFYLVGYDSFLPPGGGGSYQSYLLRKIPLHLQPYFHFAGQLAWDDLSQLLGRTLFGVVPSYFESFCYAAHELYQAGIPLILADIPAFQDYFQHEQNALIFDGSTSDLAHQIARLSQDAELRQRIACPYPLNVAPLGNFYDRLGDPEATPSSWIRANKANEEIELLVVVLCDEPAYLSATLQSLEASLGPQDQVIVARPAGKSARSKQMQQTPGEESGTMTWFLGSAYMFEDPQRTSLLPTLIYTRQALLVLRAGDLLNPGYLPSAKGTLACQERVNYVGSWKYVVKSDEEALDLAAKNTPRSGHYRLETLPQDAVPEMAPLLSISWCSRFVMRTPPGKLLVDLFDARAGRFGEIAYLWQLETAQPESMDRGKDHGGDAPSRQAPACGIVIPEGWIIQQDEGALRLDHNSVDYLFIRYGDGRLSRRLRRALLTLANREQALRKHSRAEPLDLGHERGWKAGMRGTINRMRMSRLNTWLDRLPWLKNTLKKLVAPLNE